MSFHFFKPIFVSYRSVLLFSSNRFGAFLMKFVPKYFIFFVILWMICAFIISPNWLLFLYMTATDFYILILYPTTFIIILLFEFILALILQDVPCIQSCHLQIEIDLLLLCLWWFSLV